MLEAEGSPVPTQGATAGVEGEVPMEDQVRFAQCVFCYLFFVEVCIEKKICSLSVSIVWFFRVQDW